MSRGGHILACLRLLFEETLRALCVRDDQGKHACAPRHAFIISRKSSRKRLPSSDTEWWLLRGEEKSLCEASITRNDSGGWIVGHFVARMSFVLESWINSEEEGDIVEMILWPSDWNYTFYSFFSNCIAENYLQELLVLLLDYSNFHLKIV